MATNYTKGATFERKVASDLERYGYVTVRSAGSHSPADVVAMMQGAIICVQCKLNGRLDPDEWNELWEFCVSAGATPVLAAPSNTGRRAGIIYRRLTSRKDGRGRQPLAYWTPQTQKGEQSEVS